jgi:hypothetical protein
VHNNLRSAASDHNTPEISGRRYTGTTLKAHEQEHERVSAHAAMRYVGARLDSSVDYGRNYRAAIGVVPQAAVL